MDFVVPQLRYQPQPPGLLLVDHVNPSQLDGPMDFRKKLDMQAALSRTPTRMRGCVGSCDVRGRQSVVWLVHGAQLLPEHLRRDLLDSEAPSGPDALPGHLKEAEEAFYQASEGMHCYVGGEAKKRKWIWTSVPWG